MIGMGYKNVKFLIICTMITVLLMQHNNYCITYIIHSYKVFTWLHDALSCSIGDIHIQDVIKLWIS